MDRKPSSARLIAGLFGFYLAYLLSYFIKLSPSIIMPVLQQRYSFTSGQTGFISSMYFLPYASMQLFIGPLCKKFGAGPLTGFGMVIAAAGLIIFSNGSTVAALALGRFLLGLGTCPIFIGMIYYMRESFSGERYGRYYGYGVFVSALGSIIAAAPLKAMLKVIPIQSFFMAVAVLAFALGLFMVAIDRSSRRLEREKLSIAKDIRLTFSSPILVAGLMIWIIQAPSLVCYQGLWCTKWTETAFPSLEHLSGLSGISISIGSIISSTLGNSLVEYHKKRRNLRRSQMLIRIGVIHIIVTLLLSAVKQIDSTAMFLLSMLVDMSYGFTFGTIVIQCGVYVKENTTTKDNASVMGVFNCIGCLSQQLSQWFTGVEIDLLVAATGLSLAFCLTFTTLAAIFALLTLVSFRLMKRTENK